MATIELAALTEEQVRDELRDLIALAGRVLDAAMPVVERRRQMRADAGRRASKGRADHAGVRGDQAL